MTLAAVEVVAAVLAAVMTEQIYISKEADKGSSKKSVSQMRAARELRLFALY